MLSGFLLGLGGESWGFWSIGEKVNVWKRWGILRRNVEKVDGYIKSRHLLDAISAIITIIISKKINKMTTSITDLLPSTLLQFCLSQPTFSSRFQPLHELKDPYGRDYYLSMDTTTTQRVAIRNYSATEQPQLRDVIENMQSFRKLGDVEGMCRLIAFVWNDSTAIVSAAFQYRDVSMEEILQTRDYDNVRQELYIAILRETVGIIESARASGIIIEEIIPACLLMEVVENEFRLKILYDQREKNYDKILEGIKVMASAEKLEQVLRDGREYESQNCEEAVFQLGLFLLDFIYEMQIQSHQLQTEGVFSKDLPLTRANISHKSYLTFQDHDTVELNHNLINQKVEFLLALGRPVLVHLVDLIQKMMKDLEQRIGIEQLPDQIQILENVASQSMKEQHYSSYTFMTPSKETIKLQEEKKKYEPLGDTLPNKNVYASLTTAPTQNPSNTYLPKFQQEISDPKLAEIQIPREKLLHQVRNNTSLLPKFQEYITRLQSLPNLVKKQYFDGSLYYGQLNPNGKRNNLGIYIYNNGDVYFGTWKDNTLIEGNYLFRNGESYEGVVRNGKQGYGRYCYANGNIYQGEWRDDVKHGQGKMKYPNGDVYDGMWSKGKKNGKGKYHYSNGSLYQGNFVDGKKNGFGVITFPNGTKIEAYWNQTHIEGPGKVFYSNGNFFQGNYHFSQKQGRGYYKWQDTEYQGEFKKDLMQGHACIRFSQRQYYKGSIKNGKRDGEGFYLYSNGDEYNGSWRNDQKMIGNYKFHEGGWFQGKFKRNQMSYGKMVYENQQKYQGEFLKGERHGIGIYRNAKDQVLFEGKWQHDQFISPF